MATRQLPKVDLTRLTVAEVDKLSHEALREAVKSVIRDPNLVAAHKDHRSHSSIDARILTDKIKVKDKVVRPGGGG